MLHPHFFVAKAAYMHRVFFLLMAGFPFLHAQTNLDPGDLHFLSVRSDGPKGFSFVVWKPIARNTAILFTDNGWSASDSASFSHQDEGLVEWTASKSYAAGSVISIQQDAGHWIASQGSCQGSLNGLSDSGDQIFALQGSLDSSRIIAGLNFDSTAWASDRYDVHTSQLPPAIVGHAQYLHETDNAHYAGIRFNHNRAQYIHWITDMHNSWLSYDVDSIFVSADTTAFALGSMLTRPQWSLRQLTKNFGHSARPQWNLSWPTMMDTGIAPARVLVQVTAYTADPFPADSTAYPTDADLSDGRASYWLNSADQVFSDQVFPAGTRYHLRFVPAHCYGGICLFQPDSALETSHAFMGEWSFHGTPSHMSIPVNPGSAVVPKKTQQHAADLPRFSVAEGTFYWRDLREEARLQLFDMTGKLVESGQLTVGNGHRALNTRGGLYLLCVTSLGNGALLEYFKVYAAD